MSKGIAGQRDQSPMNIEAIKKKRAFYLASSAFSLLFLGLIYAFSMFAGPMCQAYGLEKNAVALTFNIMMITFCIGAVIGAQIEKRIGLRTTLFASAALFFAGRAAPYNPPREIICLCASTTHLIFLTSCTSYASTMYG